MFINKNLSPSGLFRFTRKYLGWIAIWSVLVVLLHALLHDYWVDIPILPLTIIGTAVAFYLGFKNNQAYDRLWEARKIWGAIVNDSRSWGAMVRSFVSNQFREDDENKQAIYFWHQKLIYRHIAWLYALRSQLLLPTPWEHASQTGHAKKTDDRLRKQFGTHLLNDEITINELNRFMPEDEFQKLIDCKNTATQIIDQQAQDLKDLRSKDFIDDFRQMELQGLLTMFYTHQGKAERIKKFPLPRQYSGMSGVFVFIFIFLLPFGMVSAFHEVGTYGTWLSIPFSIAVAWVYLVMELVGDYSENPFEGLGNDIPMFSLCRVIEIDLREMLGETELPPPVEPINGVLM